jgi:anti-sigma B factor antagonist
MFAMPNKIKESNMKYIVSEEKGLVTLALTGKIMGGPEAIEINDVINRLIDEKKTKIIIDLKNVELMNSSGLGILIGAVTLLKNNKGGLRLIQVPDKVLALLKSTKLNSVFQICPTFEEAAASF